MSGNKQSRKWLLTINNPQKKGLTPDGISTALSRLTSIAYWCKSDEIGLEKKTPHTHIFLAAKSPVRFTTLQKLFPEAHIESARGSCAENKAYVEKSGKWAENEKSDTRVPGSFEEWGEMPPEPGQGFRSDIADLYDMIVNGMSNAAIMAADPALAVHISRMDKIRQDILEDRVRKEFRQLEVSYIFGATETGKTRYVMEENGYENVYRVTDYAHPFDRYASEAVLCFDEFRSSLPVGDMLNFLDGYPLSLPARYANRVACFSTVYLASNIDLKAQYPNVQLAEPATWRAFLRRIHHVLEFRKGMPLIDHGNALDYIFPPEPAWVTEIKNSTQEILPL